MLGLNVSEISLTSPRFVRLQVPPKRRYQCVGASVLYRCVGAVVSVPVCWCRCVGTGVLVPLSRYRCVGAGMPDCSVTFVPFGVQARDMELESWKDDRIQKPIHTHTHTHTHTQRRVLFKLKLILVPQNRVECVVLIVR